MTCPGSVRLCEAIVDTSSDDANRGTACHTVLESCLSTGADPQQFAGRKVSVTSGGHTTEIDFTAEMAGWVAEAVAWVRGYMAKHPGSSLRTEERIIIGRAFGCPDDLWGTADVVIAAPDELCVDDAKFGYNEVPVYENPQLLLYLIGVAADYAWVYDRYRIVITQPQCGEPKEQELTRDQLLDFVKRYQPKIAATQDPDAPLVQSDEGCRWCEAAGVCPELQKRTLALAQREFASVDLLSVDDLSMLVRHAERIRAGLKKAEEHALGLAQAGVKIPGCKVVASDKRRVWKDAGSAAKLMRKLGYKLDDIAPRSMITPPQAEKLIGKTSAKILAPLIEKPKGGPTLVLEDDEREPIKPDFEAVPDKPATASTVADLL